MASCILASQMLLCHLYFLVEKQWESASALFLQVRSENMDLHGILLLYSNTELWRIQVGYTRELCVETSWCFLKFLIRSVWFVLMFSFWCAASSIYSYLLLNRPMDYRNCLDCISTFLSLSLKLIQKVLGKGSVLENIELHIFL